MSFAGELNCTSFDIFAKVFGYQFPILRPCRFEMSTMTTFCRTLEEQLLCPAKHCAFGKAATRAEIKMKVIELIIDVSQPFVELCASLTQSRATNPMPSEQSFQVGTLPSMRSPASMDLASQTSSTQYVSSSASRTCQLFEHKIYRISSTSGDKLV